MSYDPLPNVPVNSSIICDECGRRLAGLAELVSHYEVRHPIETAKAA